MLVVTARLFKDNQLVGYRLSDGQSTQDLTKQQAWMYAKNKQIFNVVATGTEQDPGLSGIDGFELKSLPQIKWQAQPTKDIKYDAQDMIAAYIDRICSGKATLLLEMQGVESPSDYKKRYREIQIRALNDRVKNNGLKERRIWKDDVIIENKLHVGGHVVGYTLKNISTHSVGVYKMPIGKEHQKQLVELKANSSMEVSRAELALTLSQEQFSGRIGDCKLVASLKNQRIGIYEFLSGFYVLSENKEIPSKELEVNEYTKTYIVNQHMISKYADGMTIGVGVLKSIADSAEQAQIDSTDIRNAANSIQEAQSKQVKQTMQKLQNSKSVKDIFNTFKR